MSTGRHLCCESVRLIETSEYPHDKYHTRINFTYANDEIGEEIICDMALALRAGWSVKRRGVPVVYLFRTMRFVDKITRPDISCYLHAIGTSDIHCIFEGVSWRRLPLP